MIARLLAIAGLLWPMTATAQDAAKPVIRTVLEADTAIPGQAVVLRLTVLVPTWMPEPPVLPTYDLPNLMVRLPNRATTPVSERIDGETWSGISRGYRLTPLVAGAIELPAQTITITYADPTTREPVTIEGQTEALTVTGVIPKKAAALDPFIAADELALKQTVEGPADDMAPGDAVTRRLRVDVKGSAAMIIPPLLGDTAVAGLSVYAKEPVLEEKTDRGVVSGARVEEVTYVAQTGGRYVLPQVKLTWFNLKTEAIETVEVEAVALTIRGAPPATTETWDWRGQIVAFAPVALAMTIAGLIVWRLWPWISARYQHQRAAYLASEAYALRQAHRAIGSHHLGRALTTAQHWWRLADGDPGRFPKRLTASFGSIGELLFAKHPVQQSSAAGRWSAADRALRESAQAKRAERQAERKETLPPLNPQV